MLFRYKKAYIDKFDSFVQSDKQLVIAADKQIRRYYVSQIAPCGLRIKKLYDDRVNKVFEARVSDKIRIIWMKSEDLASFVFLGSHDEVRRYIKNL